jgi:phosphoglycerate dehydrogenase-like enzyme
MSVPRVLLTPGRPPAWLVEAVRSGGGTVVDLPAEADLIAWLRPTDATGLAEVLAEAPGVPVQLEYAGVEPFLPLIGPDRPWACGKGVYAPPVAELALALLLAGLRELPAFARRTAWSGRAGRNLLGADVTLVGGGGISLELARLLAPFDVRLTVVRRDVASGFPGAARVLPTAGLREAVADADAVVLTLALTPATRGLVDASVLAAMRPHAWLVNVARGAVVVTDDLVAALRDGTIGGAAMDVTDPEPLPTGHPLWSLPNCLITPHTASTLAMNEPLVAGRLRANVARLAAGEPLLGLVDPAAGY